MPDQHHSTAELDDHSTAELDDHSTAELDEAKAARPGLQGGGGQQ
jgi:hypothetical protein